MKFDIEEQHFAVFNLLLMLMVWANVCYFLVIFLRTVLPMLITTLLIITGAALTIIMSIITIYISIKWIRHHNLGWWLLVGLIVVFIISISLEATVKSIFIRQQLFEQQEFR